MDLLWNEKLNFFNKEIEGKNWRIGIREKKVNWRKCLESEIIRVEIIGWDELT